MTCKRVGELELVGRCCARHVRVLLGGRDIHDKQVNDHVNQEIFRKIKL